MKEFMHNHLSLLTAGLRPEFYSQATSVSKCTNLISHKGVGLVPFDPVMPPFGVNSGVEWNFPYPIVSYGTDVLIFDRTKIYKVEQDGTLSQLALYDIDNETSEIEQLPIGDCWSIARFTTGWVATNGVCVVLLLNNNGIIGNDNKVLVSQAMRVACVGNYNGRLLIGGFDSDHNWTSAWRSFWTTAVTEVDTTMQMHPNQIWYSSINGGNILANLTTRYMTTGFISTAEFDKYLLEQTLVNDSGTITLVVAGVGLVRHVAQLGNDCIAYTDTGLSLLKLFTNELSAGITELPILSESGEKFPGIMCSGAMNGSRDVHLVMDRFGDLWMLIGTKLIRLGYKEYFSSWTNHSVQISFDGIMFYICNGFECYVLNMRGGLSKITQLITSVIRVGGAVYGICTDKETMDTGVELELCNIGQGSSGLKTITCIQVVGSNDNTGLAKVLYRHNTQVSNIESDDYIIGADGFAKLAESGINLSVNIRFDDFRLVNISDLIVHLQYESNYTRGIYANAVTE